jgi:hypothetical protein
MLRPRHSTDAFRYVELLPKTALGLNKSGPVTQ